MARYWLMKSEPSVFSIDDLASAKDQTTRWDGVRNYQARNLLRHDIAIGDGVIFYHSSADPPAAAGTAKIVRAGYPDPTQFDPRDGHFDRDSQRDDPRWFTINLEGERSWKSGKNERGGIESDSAFKWAPGQPTATAYRNGTTYQFKVNLSA